MNREGIEASIKRFYSARQKNDPAACAAFFSENATLCLRGPKDLGELTAPKHGQAIHATMVELCKTWDFAKMQPDRVIIDGHTVVARNVGVVRHVPTQTEIETELVDMIEFAEDGKAIDFVEYFDTYTIARAVSGAR